MAMTAKNLLAALVEADALGYTIELQNLNDVDDENTHEIVDHAIDTDSQTVLLKFNGPVSAEETSIDY